MQQTMGMLIQAMDGVQTARYTGAAATTIYLYNIFLTLDLEVEYIWTGLSFHLPTLFYILNRYICLPFFLIVMYDLAGFHGPYGDDYCKSPVNYIGFMLAYTGWTGIMTSRVLALYRQRTQLVKFTRILWICVLCVTYVLGYFSQLERQQTMYYNPDLRICTVTAKLRIFKITPIVPAVYELFLTILTIIKAVDFMLTPPSSCASIPMLCRVLARDGVTYFLISITMTVANLIGWYTLPSNHLYLLCSLYWAIMSTCLAQLVLNLKDAHYRSIREQLGTEGVSAAVTFAYYTQSYSTMEGRDPFLTGEQDLGRRPVDLRWELPKANLQEGRSTPSIPSTQTQSPSLRAQSLDTPQRNGTGGDDALRDPV